MNMPISPLEYYEEHCRQGLVTSDVAQLAVLQYLEKLHHELIKEHRKRSSILSLMRKPQLIQGLYLWGGVGIGKTFLMDCFYHCLPFKNKMRMHFHQFMRMVQESLKQQQGKKNPLDKIAKDIARENIVLCFDEFFVTDIADAMILARLLKALFKHGVCLVTTSNTVPDELYKNGLQRRHFLPAIEMLKKNTIVLHVPTQIDYRLRHLKLAGAFYTPNDEIAHENMEKSFAVFAAEKNILYDPVEIHGRKIPIKKRTTDVIWFDFTAICHVPRSQHDYLAIAENYHTVFVSDIPMIASHAKDKISLFIRLIDVLYDARVRLIFCAATEVDFIYMNGPMSADFVRTRSRLLEMQSEDYFSKKLPNQTS